jgi:hypothetical protein
MGPNKLYAQAIYGEEPKTMDELAHAVIKILDEHQERRQRREGRKLVMTVSPKARCVGLAWQVHKSDLVSNSHSSPEGFKQNWGGHGDKDGIPNGYPGWQGRVWVRYIKEEGYSFGSEPFNRTLTHTGTGGGGSYSGIWEKVSMARFQRYGHKRSPDIYPEICCFSWDFKIFDADWPLVTENIMTEHEKAVIWATLNNSAGPMTPTHKFVWEDPATKAADEAFIAECKEVQNATSKTESYA